MLKQEYIDKLQNLENNQEFQQALENAANPQEVQKVLAAYNVELSEAEVQEMIQQEEGTLSETDLDDVSGGCFRPRRYRIKWIRIPPRMIPVPVIVCY